MLDKAAGVGAVICQHTLQLPSVSIRGLHLSTLIEPEAAFCTCTLHVPRLVMPYDAQSSICAILVNLGRFFLKPNKAPEIILESILAKLLESHR